MDKKDRYTYRVTWSDEDGEFVGLCAEFPSLSHLDKSQDAAFAGIRQLVADAVADVEEQGEKVPEPLALRKYTGEFVTRVSPELHRQLVIEAAELGESMNKIVTEKLSRQVYGRVAIMHDTSPATKAARETPGFKLYKKKKVGAKVARQIAKAKKATETRKGR